DAKVGRIFAEPSFLVKMEVGCGSEQLLAALEAEIAEEKQHFGPDRLRLLPERAMCRVLPGNVIRPSPRHGLRHRGRSYVDHIHRLRSDWQTRNIAHRLNTAVNG